MAIFVDASLFYAYINIDDVHHKRAKKVMEDIVSGKYGKPVTSDYIFDESVTVTMRKADKERALNLGNLIINSEVILIQVSEPVFQRAWKLFEKAEGLSFTDCTNLAFMKTFGIERIATFDKAFSRDKGVKVVDG